jgi:hypothetical protein
MTLTSLPSEPGREGASPVPGVWLMELGLAQEEKHG